jgi:hypothetical protein
LTRRYSADLEILFSLQQGRYGAAYILYTRYRILSRITTEIGLNISKPTQTGTADGVSIRHPDLFDWAQVNAGSFANVKGVIVYSEQTREQLTSLSRPTPAQRILLSHLNALAVDPQAGRISNIAMGWNIAELRRKLEAIHNRAL